MEMNSPDTNSTPELHESLNFRMSLLQLDLSLTRDTEAEKTVSREHMRADEAAIQAMRQMSFRH